MFRGCSRPHCHARFRILPVSFVMPPLLHSHSSSAIHRNLQILSEATPQDSRAINFQGILCRATRRRCKRFAVPKARTSSLPLPDRAQANAENRVPREFDERSLHRIRRCPRIPSIQSAISLCVRASAGGLTFAACSREQPETVWQADDVVLNRIAILDFNPCDQSIIHKSSRFDKVPPVDWSNNTCMRALRSRICSSDDSILWIQYSR